MKKFIWHFYYSKRFSFYPPDYYTIGLGGSESVLVLLTKYLASLNQEVHVFNACFKPGIYDNVHWHLLTDINTSQIPDIFVAVRFEDSVLKNCNAKVNLFWMLDNRVAGALKFKSLNLPNSKIIVASDAMTSLLLQENIPSDYLIKLFHPIENNIKQYQTQTNRKLICLYSSMPTRGLDVALDCWVSIQRVVKDAELWITNGYVPWGFTTEEAEDKYSPYLIRISKMQTEGLSIKYLGVLARSDFENLLSEIAILFYPSRFPEMFCLIAAECSMYGIPIITSDIFAMQERVVNNKTGYLIKGDIDHLETQNEFIYKTISLLRNIDLRENMGNNSKDLAKNLAGKIIASKWIDFAKKIIYN